MFIKRPPLLDDNTDGGTIDRGDSLENAGPGGDTAVATEVEVDKELGIDKAAPEKKPAEEVEDKEQPRDKNGKFIPKSRFDEAVQKERAGRKAAEEKLAKYAEQEQRAAESNVEAELRGNVEKLRKDRDAAVEDGDLALVRKLDKQIDDGRDQLADYRAERKAQRATAEAIAAMEYKTTLERLEEKHPQLNQDAEEYDEEKVGEVLDLLNSFKAAGQAPAAALAKAVKYVMGSAPAPKAKPAESLRDAGEVETPPAKEDKAEARKKAALAAAVDAQNKQPASLAKVGADSTGVDKIDINKISEKEFAKLSEEELAKLRGDTL